MRLYNREMSSLERTQRRRCAARAARSSALNHERAVLEMQVLHVRSHRRSRGAPRALQHRVF